MHSYLVFSIALYTVKFTVLLNDRKPQAISPYNLSLLMSINFPVKK